MNKMLSRPAQDKRRGGGFCFREPLMRFAFLTARWTNLFLATYTVPPELLTPRLPPGLDLDRRDGQVFVSLVAFQFLDTRVLGVPWPGYRKFAEVNLRFYVHRNGERGVVFIREFVPERLTAWLARVLYNEPYRATPIRAALREEPQTITAEYRLAHAGREHTISVTGDRAAFLPGADSVEHFFKEHHWGFGVTHGGRTIRFEVAHPVWEVYPVRNYRVELDWESVFGSEWKLLDGATPYSTVFAVGSAISVYRGKVVEHPARK
jgi:uncharacterized protein YqjF (DUF2071 family)